MQTARHAFIVQAPSPPTLHKTKGGAPEVPLLERRTTCKGWATRADGPLAIKSETNTCKENDPMQPKTIAFVLVNVVASLMWLRFLVRLIGQWNLMKSDVRETVGSFLVFFCLLWLTIIRDKKEYTSLVMACGILAAVYRIVWILM